MREKLRLKMPPIFKRPSNPNFPIVHYKFQGKFVNSDDLVEYKVQDLQPEYDEKAIDFWMKHFLPDEPLCHAAGEEFRIKALKHARQGVLNIVKSRVSLVCFAEGSDDIVGLNILGVESKDDKTSVRIGKLRSYSVYEIIVLKCRRK